MHNTTIRKSWVRGAMTGMGILLTVTLLSWSCIYHGEPEKVLPPATVTAEGPAPEYTQEQAESGAQFALKSLAAAQMSFSIKNGGNGDRSFSASLCDLAVNRPVLNACQYPGHAPVALRGYIFVQEQNPPGDGYATNFLIRAQPVEHQGAVFSVEKTREITTTRSIK